MITRSIVLFFLNLLPVISLPDGLVSKLSMALDWVMTANYYVPFDTFLVCAGIFFGFWLTCGVISAVLQIF